MKLLLSFLLLVAFASCYKVVRRVDRPRAPESLNALQIHQWQLDSVVVMQDGKVISKEYIQSPDYNYYHFDAETYSHWTSSAGIKTSHTGYYEYAPPEQIFFWDLEGAKQINVYSNIEVVNDDQLVYYDMDQTEPGSIKKLIYYFHAI